METYYFDHASKTKDELCGNSFWCDYMDFMIRNEKDKKFVSQNFTDCYSDFSQRFLCMVVLDLPQSTQASLHQYQSDESRGVTIKSGSELVLFKKEIKEVEVELKQDFMVTHRYCRIDSYGQQNQTQDDDAIPSEFLVNVPYECEVIMTNVSPEQIEFDLLYQIPIGSMPIKRTKFMKSQPLQLQSYSTQRTTFHFYFPKDG